MRKHNNMTRRLFFLSIALLCSSFLRAQDTTAAPAFPAAWQGVWQGELNIYNAKGLAQSVPMELHILPVTGTETYTWTIFYGLDRKAGRRSYLLKTIDAGSGFYAIDEQNSIVMEAYLLGGKLFSRFEVEGSLLLATNEVRGDRMTYEIISGSFHPVSTSGNTVRDGETIPAVKAFPVIVRQVAVLTRSR